MERIAFVLPGGGSHGATQVGMLAALVEAGIRPDFLIGVSAGALNAAAFAADPTTRGIERLRMAWVQARRSEVFPFLSFSTILGAIGVRDHLLPNDGLRTLISEVLTIRRLEDAFLPVHVMAVDLYSGEPVMISTGPALPALLASCAIPAVFPPVEIGGHLLVDGGVAPDSPVLQAEALGANRIYVLPTLGMAPARPPQRESAYRIGLRGLGLLVGQTPLQAVSSTSDAVVHVLPAPPTSDIKPFDLSKSAQLIERAERMTRAWLRQSPAARSRAFGPGAAAVVLPTKSA